MALTESEELELLQLERDRANQQAPQQPGIIKRGWDALKKPEELSRRGLEMATDAITPSMEDIEAGKASIPGMAARAGMEALTEVAPNFVDRPSILTAGLLGGAKVLKEPIKAAGKFIGKGAEELSGLTYKTPKVLERITKEPSRLFASGLEKARESYNAAKGTTPQIRDEIKTVMSKDELVKKAFEFAKDGSLSGDEALEARKTLDSIKRNVPDIAYRTMREAFDKVAKTKFGAADETFKRAIDAENVRRFLPINKGGTPSLAKGLAMSYLPALSGIASPAVQGATAAGLGVASRLASPFINNPITTVLAGNAVNEARKRLSEYFKK